MFKPQMLEAVFVAGSVLAGMTGSFWTKTVLSHVCLQKVEAPIHWRIIDPRSLRDPIGSVESLSGISLYR
jgi:hypothetical protein